MTSDGQHLDSTDKISCTAFQHFKRPTSPYCSMCSKLRVLISAPISSPMDINAIPRTATA